MKNILLKGSPGTGKTIVSRAMAYYLCIRKLKIDDIYNQDIYSDYDDIEKFIKSDAVEFIQVHPSMSYEDIIYGIEIKPSSGLDMSYTEKRIKKLCDRAKGKSEFHCIIFDDIDRLNPGSLLGNIMYAMEYRNQPVDLIDGNTMIIPDNVYIILTESNYTYGNGLEYALRRRMNYVKELYSDRGIIDKYYDKVVTDSTKRIILDVYDGVRSFIIGRLPKDPDIQVENYIPGHGMFMVNRLGTENDILQRIKYKLIYQVFPYVKEIQRNNIISGDLDTFFEDSSSKINVGITSSSNIADVKKIFYKSQKNVSVFSLQDSKNYYENTIVPNGCKEHRGIIESVIDAIFLNDIFPHEIVLSNILRNTNIVRFEDITKPGNYSAFIVKATENQKFGYLTTVSKNIRSYYSSNAVRTGRWKDEKDAPAYKIIMADGTSIDYLYLNAFRNIGFDVTQKVIHAVENTASIYCAIYKLVHSYLDLYATNLRLMSSSDSSYKNLYNLALIEKKYFELLNNEAQRLTGANNKLKHICEKIFLLKTLWTKKDNYVDVDRNEFNKLVSGKTSLSRKNYEDLFIYKESTKMSIMIKGVKKMIDLKDYQKIMNDIGVRQMIFQGPPGTSKTFESKKFVLKQLNPDSPVFSSKLHSQEDISNALREFKMTDDDYKNPTTSPKINTGGWDLVQFHPSYGYEDFIRGIEVKPVSGSPTYSSVNRILGKIAEFAKIAEKSRIDDSSKFYLIIDEINRANLANVFGELIYGLEYRDSKVSTPYEVNDKSTGEYTKDIVIGKNLFIIGTMNTADKSIDAIDYAIRRRFIFIDSPADREVVINCYQNIMDVSDENSIELLLFDSVCMLFDDERFFNNEYKKSDVKLGHTYFLRNSETNYLQSIINRFIFQVVPILREYIGDGILETREDLISNEHSVSKILAEKDSLEQKRLISENIMLFINNFGDKNIEDKTFNNKYIKCFIEDLDKGLGY